MTEGLAHSRHSINATNHYCCYAAAVDAVANG